jgi:ABC-type uncharacterized transport system substrate-binding protein
MKRKISWRLLATFFLMTVSLAEAQQPKKIPRIGFLSGRVGIEAREEAFQKGLRELGYIEGDNIIIEWRFTEGKRERQADLAADLVRLKVDCIVTAGTSATYAAKQATSAIPIVMTNVGDDPIRQSGNATWGSDLGLCSSFNILLSGDLAGLWESFLYAECLMSMSAPSARATFVKD